MAVAFPFVKVDIDTSGLQPVAQRSPGVIAVVGVSNAGSAAANTPMQVGTTKEAAELFATVASNGTVTGTPLYDSLVLCLLQDPRPAKIYGVKVASGDWAGALSALDAADDVTFVSLANQSVKPGGPSTALAALKTHVENNSANGQKRIGVAMIDPTYAKSPTYAADIAASADVMALKSDSSRMVLIAARGASGDVASAAMAAMAGYEPHISIVLKKLRGISMPVEKQYGASEILALSAANIIPIIDPSLIVGESLHFAEGRAYTTDADQLYVDIVRTLDDIDFRLKAGLIGVIGSARITRSGLIGVLTALAGVLEPLRTRGVIDAFAVRMPVFDILSVPEASRSPGENATVANARSQRLVDIFVSVTYGPAVHQLKVTLAPKF